MTDRRLLLAVARILRAAAEEAERCACEAEPVRHDPPPTVEVTDLDAARAGRILSKLGLG